VPGCPPTKRTMTNNENWEQVNREAAEAEKENERKAKEANKKKDE